MRTLTGTAQLLHSGGYGGLSLTSIRAMPDLIMIMVLWLGLHL